MLKISEGHNGTPKKNKVSQIMKGFLLCYENTYIYIGTLGHWDTKHVSRAQKTKINELKDFF